MKHTFKLTIETDQANNQELLAGILLSIEAMEMPDETVLMPASVDVAILYEE